jgi:hypothetical protein
LSEDELDIYTDYRLMNPNVLYSSDVVAAARPGVPSITVTALGGRVVINGLSYRSIHGGLPLLEPGWECLFLLEKGRDGRYWIAGTYYGALRVVNGLVRPLAAREDFAPGLRELPVQTAEKQLLTSMQARR